MTSYMCYPSGLWATLAAMANARDVSIYPLGGAGRPSQKAEGPGRRAEGGGRRAEGARREPAPPVGRRASHPPGAEPDVGSRAGDAAPPASPPPLPRHTALPHHRPHPRPRTSALFNTVPSRRLC